MTYELFVYDAKYLMFFWFTKRLRFANLTAKIGFDQCRNYARVREINIRKNVPSLLYRNYFHNEVSIVVRKPKNTIARRFAAYGVLSNKQYWVLIVTR